MSSISVPFPCENCSFLGTGLGPQFGVHYCLQTVRVTISVILEFYPSKPIDFKRCSSAKDGTVNMHIVKSTQYIFLNCSSGVARIILGLARIEARTRCNRIIVAVTNSSIPAFLLPSSSNA